MEDNGATQPNWLERMHSFLTWKVVGYDFNNPYEKKLSDKVLSELASDINALKKFTRARCLMDGEEILSVRNLKELAVETNHPTLSKFRRSDLEQYLDRCGVRAELDRQLHEIQKEIKSELERRQNGVKRNY